MNAALDLLQDPQSFQAPNGVILIDRSSGACLASRGVLDERHIPYVLSNVSAAKSRQMDKTTLKVSFAQDNYLLIRQTEMFILACTSGVIPEDQTPISVTPRATFH